MNNLYENNKNRPEPFAAPDDYFEALPTRIQHRVTAAGTASPYRTFVPRWAYYTLGFVVVIVVAVWLTGEVNTSATDTDLATTASAEQLLAEVPEDIILDYLLQVEVDVMATEPLTELEQQELLEQELDTYEYAEEDL